MPTAGMEQPESYTFNHQNEKLTHCKKKNKTFFKLEEFENAGFAFYCGRKSF